VKIVMDETEMVRAEAQLHDAHEDSSDSALEASAGLYTALSKEGKEAEAATALSCYSEGSRFATNSKNGNIPASSR
jgi:hypothetical protein